MYIYNILCIYYKYYIIKFQLNVVIIYEKLFYYILYAWKYIPPPSRVNVTSDTRLNSGKSNKTSVILANNRWRIFYEMLLFCFLTLLNSNVGILMQDCCAAFCPDPLCRTLYKRSCSWPLPTEDYKVLRSHETKLFLFLKFAK